LSSSAQRGSGTSLHSTETALFLSFIQATTKLRRAKEIFDLTVSQRTKEIRQHKSALAQPMKEHKDKGLNLFAESFSLD